MRLVVFGLTISSSWGNGHATLWRGLCRALAADGHHVTFFERDVPYYAQARDMWDAPGGSLILYQRWQAVEERARAALERADAAIVTSYCPDAPAATDLLREFALLKLFYDLDTPVTLAAIARGEEVPHIGARGLEEFDLVLSFTGGPVLDALKTLGARRALPLYGHADPEHHRPCTPCPAYRADLSYLGTYAADRQPALEELFVAPARARRQARFLLGGAQYPDDFPWSENIYFVRHMPPEQHPAFFCSSRLTLNVTRRDMRAMGWCPSGRLFEAAACGAPLVSDAWDGLDRFFEPGKEILLAHSRDDVLAALDTDEDALREMAGRARTRLLAEHSSQHRARELIGLIADAPSPRRQTVLAGAVS